MKNLVFIFVLILLHSCAIVEDPLVLSDWTEQSHGNNVSPDYLTVFAQNKVLRFDIVIDSADWETMLNDMENNYGSFGVGGGQGGPPGGPPGGFPGGPGGPGGGVSENPVFVPCSFNFEGKDWYKVGVRFKGNSSLRSCWQNGTAKLPLKLDFDQFEDDYPDIQDQRFYGFKQLSLSSNFNDVSLLREKIAADIFRDAGIRAPQTTFCRVYLDYGNGPVYFGLYTLVEVVDDTMLSDQFGSKEGNCYKPESRGASFGKGLFNPANFTKKTNEETNDWSDITGLFDILHSGIRNSNPEEWRKQLDQVFNTEYFLKWLAVNTTIQNWDTYGKMTHNYYLYNNPEDNRITWIPWDNNEALHDGKQGGALSISLDEVGSDWPLIRFLLDDPVYKNTYITHLKEITNNAFEPAKMNQKYQSLQALIKPYVTGNNGEISGYTFVRNSSDFETALQYLLNHVYNRQNIVNNYTDQ